MELGGRGRLYTYRYTVTTRMTPALRWAAMRAILMFHNCEGQSHKTVHKPQTPATAHSLLLKTGVVAKSQQTPFTPGAFCLYLCFISAGADPARIVQHFVPLY